MSDEIKLNEGEKRAKGIIGAFKNLFPNSKLIVFVTAFISAGGLSSFGILNSLMEEKVQEYARPEIHRQIAAVLDSVKKDSENRGSFRKDLSIELKTDIDSVDKKIGDWYRSEVGFYYVGPFYSTKYKRIMYKHIDGHIYRPVWDTLNQRYYFLNDYGKTEWSR